MNASARLHGYYLSIDISVDQLGQCFAILFVISSFFLQHPAATFPRVQAASAENRSYCQLRKGYDEVAVRETSNLITSTDATTNLQIAEAEGCRGRSCSLFSPLDDMGGRLCRAVREERDTTVRELQCLEENLWGRLTSATSASASNDVRFDGGRAGHDC